MRARLLVVTLPLLAAGILFGLEACSSDSTTSSSAPTNEPAATTDAGRDVFIPDANGKDDDEKKDSAPPCDLSGNFMNDIPDASLADGAATTGACLGCLQAKCPAPLNDCNGDCNCRDFVSEVITCYGEGEQFITCAQTTATTPTAKTQQIGLQLAICIQSSCSNECAFGAFVDAGTDAATQ